MTSLSYSFTEGVHAFLDVDYNYVGKVQYICAQNDITIVNSEYAYGVTFELMMENAARNVLEKNMTEMSSGKICLRDTCTPSVSSPSLQTDSASLAALVYALISPPVPSR